MNGGVFNDIEKLEADLWEAADQLRANSKLTSSDYFMPVLGIIFLPHSANRYEAAAREIAADQAAGRMAKRRLSDADFVRRRALPLPVSKGGTRNENGCNRERNGGFRKRCLNATHLR
ncbi:MAG TPA: type I restriction-modification system subunit M N-terminal domain-containing protein [Pirellulales bacterium]|nr:type I restriction-modification system subunit M N-terminal domain-containing protein [Pirellulales bacterium]